jgi:flagellar hook-basal body complex protein FliE
MTINPTQAAKAYAAAMGQMTRAAQGAKPADPAQANFSTVLQDSLNGAAEAGNKADATIISQVTGKGDVVDVVSAVAEAEIAMKTLVSVRDRMINAYQDIMKMPI